MFFPEDSSARHYLESVKLINPDNSEVPLRLDKLVNLLLIQIKSDISENTLASASSKIEKAKELNLRPAAIDLLETELNNAINKRRK